MFKVGEGFPSDEAHVCTGWPEWGRRPSQIRRDWLEVGFIPTTPLGMIFLGLLRSVNITVYSEASTLVRAVVSTQVPEGSTSIREKQQLSPSVTPENT